VFLRHLSSIGKEFAARPRSAPMLHSPTKGKTTSANRPSCAPQCAALTAVGTDRTLGERAPGRPHHSGTYLQPFQLEVALRLQPRRCLRGPAPRDGFRGHLRAGPSDGSWKHLLAELSQCQPPPVLVVSSRSADDSLWAEVLNLGGCDVLAKPFDAKEVVWAVSMAWNDWKIRARHTQPAQSALV